MLSRASNIFGLLAIIAAPVFSLFLPKSITGKLVTAHVELKDAVLLASVALLAFMIYAARAFQFVARWVARHPFYQKIDFSYIYLADGTVITRNSFNYVNGWKKSNFLAREDLIWHRRITKSDIFYRFYERGKLRDRRMTSDQPTIISAVPEEGGRFKGDHRYSWTPVVEPPLSVKERISFVVEIMALHTETAAFGVGTKLGFGVNIPTRHARLKAHAPFGYQFVLLEPELTVRRSDTLEEVPVSSSSRPKPVISPDGSSLTLSVRRPKLANRYWVHYRFEALRA